MLSEHPTNFKKLQFKKQHNILTYSNIGILKKKLPFFSKKITNINKKKNSNIAINKIGADIKPFFNISKPDNIVLGSSITIQKNIIIYIKFHIQN